MLDDVRYAARSLLRTPGLTLVTIAALTLAVGGGTAIFSVVDAVALRGLPFDEADRLVRIMARNPQTGFVYERNTPQDFLDWEQQSVFSSVAAYTQDGGSSIVLRPGGDPEVLRLQRVTSDFFDVLRVRPHIGAAFTTAHEVDGNHRVAVISDALWRNRFGGTPEIVGTTFQLDSDVWRIVGVMGPTFMYPLNSVDPTDMWIPLVLSPVEQHRGNRRSYYLEVIGRLQGEVTVDQANTRLQAVAAKLADSHPDWFRDHVPIVRPLDETVLGDARSWMLMLLGAIGFVLLVACVNIAHLLLARAAAQSRAVTVRLALGASRWDIVRGLLAESLLLSAVCMLAALLVAAIVIDILHVELPQPLSDVTSLAIDARVLIVTGVIALVTTVGFGLIPIRQLSRLNLAGGLHGWQQTSSARISQRMRSAFIVAEVAFTAPLLIAAALFSVSLFRLTHLDLGLDPRNVVTTGVYLRSDPREPDSRTRIRNQFAVAVPAIIARLQASPGIEAAALIAGGVPFDDGGNRTPIVRVPGREKPFTGEDGCDVRYVTPDYAKAMRMPVRAGRFVDSSDVTGSPAVVVLNEEAAQRYFGTPAPVGERIFLSGERTVVGVVANVPFDGPASRVAPAAYLPFGQSSATGGEFVVRTASSGPDSVVPALRAVVRASLPDVPLREVMPVETLLRRTLALNRFTALVCGLLTVLALSVAAVGIYGVLAYIVAQRTRELGLRIALGAQPKQVLLMVFRNAGALLLVGLAIGLAAAWSLTRLLGAFLPQVKPDDPAIFAAAAAVLLVSGLLAALGPSLRASRVDPLVAVREE